MQPGQTINYCLHGRMREDRWLEIGRLIRISRTRLYPTLEDFAAATGLTTRTLHSLEHGRAAGFSPRTLAAVEDALEWAPGSIDAFVTEGRNVLAAPDPVRHQLAEVWLRLSPEKRRALVAVARILHEL